MHRKTQVFTLLAGLTLFGATPFAQENSRPNETPMTTRATGTFDVNLAPLDLHFEGSDKLGRMSIDKTFHGDLEATSRGEMLTAMTDVKGSAVYVAIERVTGTLDGKKGSFVLHHRGVMHNGEQQLEVRVVPNSGTDELQGISGEMNIRIEEGTHFFDFKYALPNE